MLADSCSNCEDYGFCPGRPPARPPTSGFAKFTGRKDRLEGRLLGEVHVLYQGSFGEFYCKLLQLIEWEDGNRVHRLCYYVIKPGGKAAWGQFAPMYNPGELKLLLRRARDRGILRTED